MIKNFVYIEKFDKESEIYDPSSKEQVIYLKMDVFDQYIEKSKFDKLYKKADYQTKKDYLKTKRNNDVKYCGYCEKDIKNYYYEEHCNKKSHLKNYESKRALFDE